MLNKKILDLLNDQINEELYSAYLYLYFSNFYEEKGLEGFSNWYYVQAREEFDHAMLIKKYLNSNGEKVVLKVIKEPKIELKDYIDPVKAALEHEKYITQLIHNIYMKSDEIKDFRTMQFLDWFIKEQCEEEEIASNLFSRIILFGSDRVSLYMLDTELKKRMYKSSF